MMISMRLIPIITLILLLQPCIFGKMTRFSIPKDKCLINYSLLYALMCAVHWISKLMDKLQ